MLGVFTQSTLPEGHPESQSERALLRVHRQRGALSTLVGGHHCIGRAFLGSQADLIVMTFLPEDVQAQSELGKLNTYTNIYIYTHTYIYIYIYIHIYIYIYIKENKKKENRGE